MPNKLQELTDKLYNEGLSKGQKEAEEMKAAAREEAARIIADARAEAEKITADARRQAAELRSNTENDLRMASAQTVATIKHQVENIIVAKAAAAPVKDAMSPELVKDVLMTIAKAFNPAGSEPVALELILPAAKQTEMAEFVKTNAEKVMGEGFEVSFSKYFQNGFKIGPKGEGYTISFTDDDFSKMLSDFLRPGTKKLLFG